MLLGNSLKNDGYVCYSLRLLVTLTLVSLFHMTTRSSVKTQTDSVRYQQPILTLMLIIAIVHLHTNVIVPEQSACRRLRVPYTTE